MTNVVEFFSRDGCFPLTFCRFDGFSRSFGFRRLLRDHQLEVTNFVKVIVRRENLSAIDGMRILSAHANQSENIGLRSAKGRRHPIEIVLECVFFHGIDK